MVFTTESLLAAGVLTVKDGQQMREVGIVNVPPMEFLRGRSFERVGGGLVDEGSQELPFALSEQHDQYLGSA